MHHSIPQDDLLGVTALLLTCSYKGAEFVRVGYYVNIEYTDPELAEADIKPNPPIISQLQRSIMADHPRVTRFPHDFDKEPAALPEVGLGLGACSSCLHRDLHSNLASMHTIEVFHTVHA